MTNETVRFAAIWVPVWVLILLAGCARDCPQPYAKELEQCLSTPCPEDRVCSCDDFGNFMVIQ